MIFGLATVKNEIQTGSQYTRRIRETYPQSQQDVEMSD